MLRGAEGHYWLVIKMTHNKLNIEINNILPVFGVDPLLGEADQEPRQSPMDTPVTVFMIEVVPWMNYCLLYQQESVTLICSILIHKL